MQIVLWYFVNWYYFKWSDFSHYQLVSYAIQVKKNQKKMIYNVGGGFCMYSFCNADFWDNISDK